MSEQTKEKFEHAKDHERSELERFMIPGERIIYTSGDIVLTQYRIIKYESTWWSKLFHYFYHTFEDLTYKSMTGIKAKNVINLKLFSTGVIIFLLGPIGYLLSKIPGIGALGSWLQDTFAQSLGAGGIFLLGTVLIAFSLILRDRHIEFIGSNVVLRTQHFSDEELQKVRELQLLSK